MNVSGKTGLNVPLDTCFVVNDPPWWTHIAKAGAEVLFFLLFLTVLFKKKLASMFANSKDCFQPNIHRDQH